MLYLFVPVKIAVDIDSVRYVGTDVVVRDAADGQHGEIFKSDGNGGISDKPFKILAFTDTHFGTYKEKGGSFTVKYMLENIYMEKPDLVVFVGDVVTSATNRARAKQLAEVMEKLGVYWAAVLGNHEGDNIRSISRKEFVELYASYPHCLISAEEKFTSGGEKVWGNGNTQIDILAADGSIAQTTVLYRFGQRDKRRGRQGLRSGKGQLRLCKAFANQMVQRVGWLRFPKAPDRLCSCIYPSRIR